MLLLKRTTTHVYDLNDLENYYGIGWKLSDISGYGAFTDLFDEYKICMVKMRCRSSYNMANQSSTGITGGACQHFHYAIDYTDNTPPLGYQELEKYQTHQVRMITGDKPFDITVRPKISVMAYEGVGTGYMPVRSRWIATDDAAVPHYGIKFGTIPTVIGVANTTVGRLTVYTTYYIALRNTK